MQGTRCDACGASLDAAPRLAAEEPEPRARQRTRANTVPEMDLSGLDRAFEAFRSRDFPRFVEHVLASEPAAAARSTPSPEGPGWIAAIRGALVFVTLVGEDLTLEAPVARLPRKDRLPSLRLALELCAQESASARVALRGPLLLLRFTGRVSTLTPALLRFHVRDIGQLAGRYAGLLGASCEALPAIPDNQGGPIGFDLLGPRRKIQLGGPRRSIPPPAAADADDGIPAILAPMFSTSGSAADPKAGADLRRRPTVPTLEATRPATQDPSRPRSKSMVELEGFGQRSMSTPGIDLTTAAKSTAEALAPPDRLCALLGQAKALAPPTLEARPATVTWLVRSAVFRAIYDFRDALPDAVAHLYGATGVGREGPLPSRSAELAAIEPALAVLDRVIAAGAQVSREPALVVPPMTTAAQAKEHVAKYLGEIEKAPADPAVKHYLGLGALTELLVRTKLPPQTDQRLRDIVAHAQREGAKQPAIDLVMTALQRINA